MTADAADSDGPVQPKTWRVTVDLYVPMGVPLAEGQPPAQLTFESRLVPGAMTYGDHTILLRPPYDPTQPTLPLAPGWERLLLVTDVVSPDNPHAALGQIASTYEALLDRLSFDLATGISFGQVEILDITRPVKIGDERQLEILSCVPFDRYARVVDMQSIRGAARSGLPPDLPQDNRRTAAALRWFVKSLNTQLLHDQFIFLWIALEILCDLSEKSTKAPYQAKCNHFIKHCPECGASTAREVRGRTLQSYLTEEFGVDGKVASDLWSMRQLMHGAISFDSSRLENLPSLIQPLRSAVGAGLKVKLGKNASDAPLIDTTGLSIHPAVGLGGTRKITAEDLLSLTDEVSLELKKAKTQTREPANQASPRPSME